MPIHVSPPADGVIVAAIDRGKANALDAPVVDALRNAVRSLGDTEALVITGRGDMFCAGLDTAIVSRGDEGSQALLDSMGALLFDILESPRPVVVAADGHGIAAGAMMMLCADFSVACTAKARYGFGEVPMGLPLPAPVVALIAERTHPSMRLRIAAHGELLDGAHAVAAGIADESVASEQVELAAVEHAQRLAALPGDAYEQTKRLVNEIVIERMRQT